MMFICRPIMKSMFAVMRITLFTLSPCLQFNEYDYEPVEDLYAGILEAAINIRGNPDEYEDTFAPGNSRRPP